MQERTDTSYDNNAKEYEQYAKHFKLDSLSILR